MSSIHKTAIIEDGAVIGKNVSIGPGAYIGAEVSIGDNCTIGANVVIEGCTIIGSDNQFYVGSVIGSPTQALAYKGEKSYVKIGSGNIVREYVTVNGTEGKEHPSLLGDKNLLMAYSHVAHHCTLGSGVIMANSATLAGHVEVEDRAVIGGLAAIHQFVKIGRLSIIGGLSKVVKDVTPFMTVDGNPCRVVGLNSIGLKRAGFSKETIGEIRKAYRTLFREGLNTTQAMAKLKSQAASKDVQTIIEFIEKAERGIIKARKNRC